MTQSTLPRAAEDEMHCPTCHAPQAWSDQCRRCKCDLSLLRQVWRAGEAERRRCLAHLRAGRPDRALPHARRYAAMVGAAEASRLLAVCHVLGGHWRDAWGVFGDSHTKSQPTSES